MASAVPIGKPEMPENTVLCVDVMPLGANARQVRSVGVSDGSRLAIYRSLSSECPSSCCARARMRHASVFLMDSLCVSASYVSFLAFAVCQVSGTRYCSRFCFYFCFFLSFCHFCLVLFLCSRWSFLCR